MSQIYQHTLPAGARVENYQISKVLGVGGFGVTYRARDTHLDCDVAIKEYLPADIAVRNADGLSVSVKSASDANSYEHGLKRFLDEARVLALFREPNIVRVTRYLEANGTAYFVMDYEDGEPLDQRLKRLVSLDESACIRIAQPLLHGLRTVHARNFLHRDIKPANIYLRRDQSPVLIDFGAARAALGERNSQITGMVTHGYAPFEQYSPNGRLGPWTDLYALGATLYHCVTGVPPPGAPERIDAIHDGKADTVDKVCHQLARRFSAGFRDILCRMLAPHAANRPQSADAVIEAFEAIQHESRAPTPGRTMPTSSTTGFTTQVNGQPDWKPEALQAVEATLEIYVGPLAHILVRKMAASAISIEQLTDQLSRFIPSDVKRREFLDSTRQAITTGSARESPTIVTAPSVSGPPANPVAEPSVTLDPEMLTAAERALAIHLGPVARILVRKSARASSSLDDLYRRLAEELSTTEQRKAFLAAVRRRH